MNLKGYYLKTIIFSKSWVKTITKCGFILLHLLLILIGVSSSFGSKTSVNLDSGKGLQISLTKYHPGSSYISSDEIGFNPFTLFSETENCNENNVEEDFGDDQVMDHAGFASLILFQNTLVEEGLVCSYWFSPTRTQTQLTIPFFILYHSWKSYLV